jgi:hypothetical protein
MNENFAGSLSLNVTITGIVETRVVTVKAEADSLVGELLSNIVESFQLEDKAIESLKAKDDFELKVHHSLKLDGVRDGDNLVLTVGQGTSFIFLQHSCMIVVNTLYFERQVAPDTCFRHALNHYTQKSYANSSFLEVYKKLLSANFDKIFEVKMEHMNSSFYGDMEGTSPFTSDRSRSTFPFLLHTSSASPISNPVVPTGKLEEKSAPELDEDLNGKPTKKKRKYSPC